MNKKALILTVVTVLLMINYLLVNWIYENYVKVEQPIEAVVRPGYRRFRKSVDGYNFRYPIGWRFDAENNLDEFINGTFYDQNNNVKLYLEAPYIGHRFKFSYKQTQAYFDDPLDDVTSSPVVAVSTTIFQTNDPTTPIIFQIYQPCRLSNTTTACQAIAGGTLAVAYWQRGKVTPVLSDQNESSQDGVFFMRLPPDKNEPDQAIEQFNMVITNFRFNDAGAAFATSSTRVFEYQNQDYNFYFLHPKDYTIKEKVDLSFVSLATGTEVDYPEAMTTGTNLIEAKILFGPVSTDQESSNCLPANGSSSTPAEVVVNGTKFLKSVSADAAAGNRYDTITYALRRDGRCFNITLFLHSSVLENYPPELRPQAFDREKIVTDFYSILNTVYFN